MSGTRRVQRSFGYRFLEPAALARVKNLSIVARGVVEGFISGLHASPYKGFSVEFADHREYAPGDNPRHLDWRTLARTDRLYIRQYEEETNLRAQILLDGSGSMNYRYDDAPSKFQYGAYLSAILAYLMTRQQDAVGLTVFDSTLRLDMPARSSARHLGEVLRQLEQLAESRDHGANRRGSTTRIADTLHQLADRYTRRRLIILISDLYDEPEAVLRAFHHFRHRHHELMVFHVFDKTELEFPFRETMQFEDLETGERLQVDPAYVRDEYRKQLEEFVAFFRKGCADVGAEYVMTDTSVPYDFMLSRHLALRMRL